MSVDKDLVKMAVDIYRGSTEKYSLKEAEDALYDAIVTMNGGSTKFGYKEARNAQYNGLYALIEELIPNTIVEGLQGDEYFNRLVEVRNVAAGDSPVFEVEDVNWYEVSKVAHGVRGLRRQRLGGRKTATIDTELHGVRIYEPMRRLLARRVDFNNFITRVGESYRQNILNDVYTCWAGLSAESFGGTTFFPTAGSYDENAVLDVIEHAQAVSGKQAVIWGTAKALRNLAPAVQGTDSKSDLYNMGYYGKFYGTDVYCVPQRHKVGTTDFIFDDKSLNIIASDSQPIKLVYEGDSIIKLTDPLDNADMTTEYEFYDAYGIGIVTSANDGIGRIQIA